MAQFDVHRNTGRLRETIHFVVVVVQSSPFDGYRRRVVVPLVRANTVGQPALHTLSPRFTVRNVRVVLHPLDVVSIPVDQLGERVGSLAHAGDAIIGALDEVVARAWK
jgi:toxin CcdB